MTIWLNILIITITFLIMEFVAWFTHKYIMHGFLWHLHQDHHDHSNNGPLQKNDWFFLIFAVPSALGFILGSIFPEYRFLFFIAIGIALYGFAYFIIHEIFIHQRLKFFRNTKNKYLLGIRKAHKVHHKKMDKLGGSCFGMLIVPFKYFHN
ncbi:MAG: sterol desaturase family protein [Flavobacteriales bacterium]|nr:sterol desaturase family protein [Flavobacteriales bacterium]